MLSGMEIQGRCMAPLVKQLLGWDSALSCRQPPCFASEAHVSGVAFTCH